MSRVKFRNNVEVCGDCGAADATWASINKGILLCTQCCCMHRRLGRHISQVKSLQKSTWIPSQLNMVYTLNNNGANNIWEYDLLENNAKLLKKKPSPKDAISTKEEYIRLKHEKCLYAFKGDLSHNELLENEFGKQLHASVRSPNLETSFRLLVQGADPNYFHDEKGSTPLHVAVKHGQKLQGELLLVHGADPESLDNQGKTVIDLAKSINSDFLERLLENQYEVTDALIEYLANRKPEHQKGIHFHIPSVAFESNPNALNKLQKMRNSDFEELVMDVFDEVDRRQTDAVWLSCVDALELTCIPFLPSNTKLSTTRNQGRQKLATFSTPELKSLVYDILVDTQRRQMFSVNTKSRAFSQLSLDDDPLYDTVASDEETPAEKIVEKDDKQVRELTKQLQESVKVIDELKSELSKLKSNFEDLKFENIELKSKLSKAQNTEILSLFKQDDSFNRKNRPMSMVERGENRHLAGGKKSTSLYHNHDHILKEPILECSELITRSIQYLIKAIQNNEDITKNAEKVKRSVMTLANILKNYDESKAIKSMLIHLPRLLHECNLYQTAANDGREIEAHFVKIRESAYNLAVFTKEIVTKYSSQGKIDECNESNGAK